MKKNNGDKKTKTIILIVIVLIVCLIVGISIGKYLFELTHPNVDLLSFVK